MTTIKYTGTEKRLHRVLERYSDIGQVPLSYFTFLRVNDPQEAMCHEDALKAYVKILNKNFGVRL